jgi:hypothetical protein
MSLAVQVECYAGYKADERPLRFRLVGPLRPADQPASAARTFEIIEVLDQWYGVGYQCFKVLADDGNLYILRHNQQEDAWTLDSFRQGSETSTRYIPGQKSKAKS